MIIFVDGTCKNIKGIPSVVAEGSQCDIHENYANITRQGRLLINLTKIPIDSTNTNIQAIANVLMHELFHSFGFLGSNNADLNALI